MKIKKSILVMLASLLLLTVPALASAAPLDRTDSDGPIIIKVSKEEAQRLRAEAGFPNDESVTGGFIVYPENSSVPGDSTVTPSEIGGNEYFVKNPKTSYRVDYNDPYLPGASGCNMTLTTSASFSKTTTITGNVSFSASMLKIITATIGANFAVGETKTVTSTGSKAVNGCQVLKGYPRYEEKTGELWEDDAFFDDYISPYKATRLESIYFETRSM